MKINIVIDIRPLMHGHLTGVDIFTIETLKALFELDKENNYILYHNSFTSMQQNIPDFSMHSNVTQVRTKYPNKILNILLSFLNWPKIDELILKKLQKNKNNEIKSIDFFLMPDPRPIALKKAKLLTVFHDLSFIRYPHFFSFYTGIWHKILRPKKIAQKSTHIISVSNFTKNEIIKCFKIAGEKISVIHEGQGTAHDLTIEQVNKTAHEFNLPKKYFLFISTLEPRKNLERLIKAYELFLKNPDNKDYKLIIIGKENAKIFRKVDIEISKNIIKLGFVGEESKLAILSKAHALVYPSLYEGFGLPILESFYYNKPVAASNISSIPEVAGDAAILFDPLDINEIKNSLEKLTHPKIYKNLQHKIPNQLSKFSWHKCAKQIHDHFSLAK